MHHSRTRCWRGESNPQRACAPGALDAVRLPVTPPQPKFSTPTLTPGGGLEPPQPVPKTGVLPLDDPGTDKRTRHDSNVRPQAPQACALIHLSYGSEGGGRCGSRTHRSASRSDSFRDCAACPCRNLPRLMHQEGVEPPTPRRATALQAAAEPIRPLMRV